MESKKDLIKLIENTLKDEALEEYAVYAPVHNSKTMLGEILGLITDDKKFNEILFFKNLEETLGENNVGLLAAKSLDYFNPLQQYANNLHTIWASFLSILKLPHLRRDQLNATQQKAYDFYDSQQRFKKNHDKIMDHLYGIDFSKLVDDDYKLHNSAVVAQWRAKGVPQGDYYSKKSENNPLRLGIHYEQENTRGKTTRRIQYLHKITLNKGITVLKSTARAVLDTWSIKNQTHQTCGGAIQYFNSDTIKDFKELP